MVLTVFGATGPSGRLIVERALEQEHSVRAFARNPARLDLEHPRLEVAAGVVLDQDAVDAAIGGSKAVISCLGIRRGSSKTIVTDGTRRILAGMQTHDVRRFIGLSAYGAGETRNGSPYSRLTWLLLRPNLEDKERYEDLVRATDLDWTLVRPARLTDGPETGRYRAGTDLRMKLTSKISRADLAAFIVDQLRDPTWVRGAPSILAS
ncbi:MAG: NAD(P)-dependent oxidoreductase [Solirubrobacterales bacterium]